MADQIGSQVFFKLEGGIVGPSVTLQDVTRVGVNGVAFRQTGSRGKPFTLRGVIDVANVGVAEAVRATYESLIGSIVSITKSGVTWAEYIVLDVTIENPQPLISAVGGVSAGNAILRSNWTLQSVAT
jgi:hypothetical protein